MWIRANISSRPAPEEGGRSRLQGLAVVQAVGGPTPLLVKLKADKAVAETQGGEKAGWSRARCKVGEGERE